MASTPKFYDRVLETSTFTGTTTPITLLGAVTGYQSWAAVANGNSAQYYIEAVDASGIPNGKWEVGVGTYTSSGTTLSRTTILASSNSGSIESFDSGTKRVGLSAVVAAVAPPVISDWGGRLTLESGVAISTSDQLAKTHLYYTPYLHNRTPKWNGSSWERVEFAEYDLSGPTLTSGAVYDVFWNGSALSLSTVWTNATTRADALSTQDGVQCLSSDHTKLLVGTICASATNQMSDSGGLAGTTQVGGKRFVWNLYNQIQRTMKVIDKTDTWTYNSATPQQANATAGNKVEYVCGYAGLSIDAVLVSTGNSVALSATSSVGIGVDATNAYSGLSGDNSTGGNICLVASYRGPMLLGYHYIAWCEAAIVGTVTFAGDAGIANFQSGLNSYVWC